MNGLQVTDATGAPQTLKTVFIESQGHRPVHILERDLDNTYGFGVAKKMMAGEEQLVLIVAPIDEASYATVKVKATGFKSFVTTLFEKCVISGCGEMAPLKSCNRFIDNVAGTKLCTTPVVEDIGTPIFSRDEFEVILKNDATYLLHIFSEEDNNIIKIDIEVKE